MKIEQVDISTVSPDPANVRTHSERNLSVIKGSLARFGQQTPIVVDGDGVIRKGNGTYEAAVALGWAKINVVRTALKGAEATAYAIADNRSGDPEVGSLWDSAALAETLEALKLDESIDETVTGFDDGEIAALLVGLDAAGGSGEGGNEKDAAPPKTTLVERFGVPPFSILDARQGYWQDRKRAWLAIGIQSEIGRGGDLIPNGGGMTSKGGYARERERE